MAKVAILFIVAFVAFVPSLQAAGVLERLTAEIEDLKTIQANQSAEMARMNKKGAQCGYRYRWYDNDSTITYEAEMVNTGSGLLDTATGVWTAEDSGLYQVSWSLQHSINSGEINSISLSKNGVEIQESNHYSRYTNARSANWVTEQGSRTLFLDLHKGDNLKLVTTTTFAGQAYRTIFCVSLQSAS